MMKQVIYDITGQVDKELFRLGFSREMMHKLLNEGVNSVPYKKLINGRIADELFIVEKGAEDLLFCIIGNFISYLTISSNTIEIHEVPMCIFEGCTADDIISIIAGSKDASFNLMDKIRGIELL